MPPFTSWLGFHASLLARGSTYSFLCIGLGIAPLGLNSSWIWILSTLYMLRYSLLGLRGVPQCFSSSWTSCTKVNKSCFMSLVWTLVIGSPICCKEFLGMLDWNCCALCVVLFSCNHAHACHPQALQACLPCHQCHGIYQFMLEWLVYLICYYLCWHHCVSLCVIQFKFHNFFSYLKKFFRH